MNLLHLEKYLDTIAKKKQKSISRINWLDTKVEEHQKSITRINWSNRIFLKKLSKFEKE